MPTYRTAYPLTQPHPFHRLTRRVIIAVLRWWAGDGDAVAQAQRRLLGQSAGGCPGWDDSQRAIGERGQARCTICCQGREMHPAAPPHV